MSWPKRVVPWYLFVQGLAILAWWVTLLSSDSFRGLFEMGPAEVLDNFFVADVALGLFCVGTALASSVAPRWAPVLIAMVFGALMYATAMTFSWVGHAETGHLGTALMSLACLGTLCALLLSVDRS